MSDGDVASSHSDVEDRRPSRKVRRLDTGTRFAVAVAMAPAAADVAGGARYVLWYGVLMVAWHISACDPTKNILHQQANRRCVVPGSHCVDYRIVDSMFLIEAELGLRGVVPKQARRLCVCSERVELSMDWHT